MDNGRAGRGMSVVAGFLAAASALPLTVLLIHRWAPAPRPADTDLAARALPLIVVPLAGVAVFLVLRLVRAALSRRYVAACVARGSYNPYRSPAFGITLAAWLVLLAGLAVAGATAGVTEGEQVDADLAHADRPGFLVLSVVGVALTAAYFSWDFRRRNEVPALEAAGVVRRVDPPEELPPGTAARLRLKMFLIATVIEGLFSAGAILPRLLPGAERPTSDDLMTGVFMLVGGPAVISFVLLACLVVLAPTRQSALDALRRPSSLVAIGLVVAGLAVDAAGRPTIGGIIALPGLLLGSATCLNIMERGRQPWLGLTFILFSFWLGYLAAPDGSAALPSGMVGWAVALVAAGYAAHQARGHWRTWHGLTPGDGPGHGHITEPATT